MSSSIHRDLIAGEIAGLIAGILFVIALQFQSPGVEMTALLGFSISAGIGLVFHLLATTLAGGLFGMLFRYTPRAHAALASSGVLFALILWIIGPLTLSPIVMSETPTWSLAAAQAAFPSLVGHLLYGGLLGLLFPLTRSLLFGSELEIDEPEVPEHVQKIVVLGGGFGGVEAARRLGEIFSRDREVEVHLVSESNYMLFTPMLAEVASSALEPQHISVPIRVATPHTIYHYAKIKSIDAELQHVELQYIATGKEHKLDFSQLVLAMGSVPHFLGLDGVEENAFTLKTLKDASGLREHVLSLLAIADHEVDVVTRRELLSFVVIGGGFAGAEVIAELHDFVHSVLHYYKNIALDDLRFVLVHSRERILPELGEDLALYAQSRLKARGIELLLNRRAQSGTSQRVILDDDTELSTRTLVWTAGNRPHPVLSSLGCELNPSGAVICENQLRVKGFANIWAVGDCAEIPNPESPERTCPPTAQHAIRQGRRVAENVAATLKGDFNRVRPFEYKIQGILVVLGRYTAVAEIMGIRFSGFFAWFLWRTIYLYKLPGLQKKLRVVMDWTLDLFFPRDIALTQTEYVDSQRYDVPEVESESEALISSQSESEQTERSAMSDLRSEASS